MEKLGLVEARACLGELVDRACLTGVPTVITRHRNPVAVIISVAMWESTADQDPVALGLLGEATGIYRPGAGDPPPMTTPDAAAVALPSPAEPEAVNPS
jgi:prevent-host-death family protein